LPLNIVRRAVGEIPAPLARGAHPVLARVLHARGIEAPEQIDYSLARLLPFDALSGIGAAAALLGEAVREGRRMLVVGDFDADGATGCAVAVRGLRMLGAREVDYLVPNRFEYGYGLTPEIVEVASRSAPDLLITVDNGISSVDGVAAANDRDIPVLVTDHHLVGERLPAAAAIVNPNQPGDVFPSKALAGVGVAFYVLLAARAWLRQRGWFEARAEPRLAELLDLVAVGTMADVVPLDHNNRVLIAQGLARIRAGRGRPGLAALLGVAKRDLATVTGTDLAFAVAPRLNAAGRLADMSTGIACLLTDDPGEAARLAAELDAFNRERRRIEADMQAQALDHLDDLLPGDGAQLPLGVCLYHPEWHQGVVGILAARIKERVNRPVIAFAPAGDGELRGSARSVPGLHVRDALDAIAAQRPGLLSRFGGHAMAAGLSLDAADLQAFSEAFDAEVRRRLPVESLERRVDTDGALCGEDLEVGLAEALRAAGPWGQDFPEPLFDGEFEVRAVRIVGADHLKLSLAHPESGVPVDAIAFNRAAAAAQLEGGRVRVVYRLEPNTFRGITRAQLVVEHLEPAL
jgi:single-stranded-DNA-specific exonuclease